MVVETMIDWAIPEKKTGVKDMEFPGVVKKWQVDFPGVN